MSDLRTGLSSSHLSGRPFCGGEIADDLLINEASSIILSNTFSALRPKNLFRMLTAGSLATLKGAIAGVIYMSTTILSLKVMCCQCM